MTGLRRLASTLGDRYVIERELGAGGMARVYLARDLKHDRDVALKILPAELNTATGAERFLNEVRITSSLDHPNILTLIDSGSNEGALWYVVPYIRGESLRERLKREGQLPLDDAINIARQVAAALEFAHARGIVHRDVKPENILLHEGVALLADFGVALAVAEAGGDRLTGTGHSVGTPQYMSPEQATHDRHLDLRTDIYSLGAVLYEMLAGEPPHTGPNAQAVIARLLTEKPTPLRLLRDTVPEPVEAAVARALAKIPADRFPRASQFADQLTAREAAKPWLSRRVRRWSGAALVVLLLVLGVMGFLRLLRKPAGPPPPPEITQLTSSGRATSPIFSPDGSQVAYAIRDCDTIGVCRQRLVVREVAENTERAIVEGVIGTLRVWGWSPNGLRILYAVYDSEDVTTAFVVPRLGGTPTRLGPYTAGGFAGTDDTLLLHPYRPDWVGRMDAVTAATGEVADTIPLPSTIGPNSQLAVSRDGRWLAAITRIPNRRTHLDLVDRRGRVASDTLEGSYSTPRWDPESRGLVVASAGSSPDHTTLVRFRVDARSGRVTEPEPDLVADLETGRQTLFVSLFYDLAPRGGGVAYMRSREGSYTMWAIGRRTAQVPFARLHRIETSTQVFTGLISGDGSTVFTMSGAGDGDSPMQWFVQPFESGAPRQITPVLSSIGAFSIPVDGRRLLLSSPVEGHSRLDWYDALTGERTTFAEISGLSAMTWIVAGGVAWTTARLDTLHVLDALGQPRLDIALPDSVLPAFPLPASPDGTEIALIRVGARQESRPWGVYRVSVRTGAVTLVTRMPRFATFSGHSWTGDGWMHLQMRAFGALRHQLYRVRASGGEFEREAQLPFESSETTFTFSLDGLRGVVTETNYQSDLMLERPHAKAQTRPAR